MEDLPGHTARFEGLKCQSGPQLFERDIHRPPLIKPETLGTPE